MTFTLAFHVDENVAFLTEAFIMVGTALTKSVLRASDTFTVVNNCQKENENRKVN